MKQQAMANGVLMVASPIVAGVLMVLLVVPVGAQVRTQAIALTGQGSPDGDGMLLDFGTALVNQRGQVAFWASLTGTSGGNMFPRDNEGLFRGDGKSLLSIARNLQPSPGGHGLISGPGFFALNDAGQVAFYAQLIDSQGASIGGSVFRGDGQALTQMAHVGQLAPNGNGTFNAFAAFGLTPVRINNEGQVVFQGSLSDLSSNLFRGDGRVLTQIARTGQPAPDGNGNLDPRCGWTTLNQAGQVAFIADLFNTDGENSDNKGVFLGDGRLVTQIARVGQPAPDGNGRIGSFAFDLRPALNDAGQVAFAADLVGASGGVSRVFLGAGGELTEIARSGLPAPDGNGTLTGFDEDLLLLNNAGQMAFRATLPGIAFNFAPNRGLYLGDGSDLVQIVRTGQPAPGGIGTIGSIDRFALNDVGQVAFRAFLTGPPINGDSPMGLYAHDGIDLIQLARSGELVDLGGGDVRTIGGIGFDPSLNNRGQLAYSLRFTDGTSGVFLTAISQLSIGDYNGNGLVEQADLDLVLLNWGEALINPTAAGWVNDLPTGFIDQEELDRVLLNWGITGAAPSAARVPEPATWLLILLATLGWLRANRSLCISKRRIDTSTCTWKRPTYLCHRS